MNMKDLVFALQATENEVVTTVDAAFPNRQHVNTTVGMLGYKTTRSMRDATKLHTIIRELLCSAYVREVEIHEQARTLLEGK